MKYPIEIKLENGFTLQIHREHFTQYHLFLFNSKGNQKDECYLEE